jgi:hypothetical protein
MFAQSGPKQRAARSDADITTDYRQTRQCGLSRDQQIGHRQTDVSSSGAALRLEPAAQMTTEVNLPMPPDDFRQTIRGR